MPKRQRSLRREISRKAIARRWIGVKGSASKEELFEAKLEEQMEVKVIKEENDNSNDTDIIEKIDLEAIGDLFELCKKECGSRKLSMLLYMLMRKLGHSWRSTDEILANIGAYRCQTAHKWIHVFLMGYFEVVAHDGRGGKHSDSFYDVFPELEADGIAFAVVACSQKEASFSSAHLANFIDTKYYELTQTVKNDDKLIRSHEACRIDLRRWGAKFQPNSQRPYFEGHERSDVVAHREEFISYFLNRKDSYYTVTDGKDPVWQIPTRKPCILIYHDESTFRSGDISPKRWTIEENTPFFNKGRGRSHMMSDFLVSHPSGPFFSLSSAEFEEAKKKYPNLLHNVDSKYIDYSPTAGINIGEDAYFDNETVLEQFERMFHMIQFKDAFKDHEIEVVVDNARMHSAKEYSLNDFGKGVGGTRCPVNSIEYVNNQGKNVKISCYFSKGVHTGMSKGLLLLAKEMKFVVDDSIKLDDLRLILSSHSAFQNTSKLEKLALKYNVKIIFTPKFHCELNPIEGLWCHMKQYVRKRNDQTFSTMLKLIPESRENFSQKQIQLKLIRRFWKVLDAYKTGQTYGEVLTLFFSNLCKSSVVSHRKVTNTNLQL